MPLSPEELEAEFRNARALVEQVIVQLGLDPQKVERPAEPRVASWTLKRGTAAILITLSKGERDDGASFRVASPIMTLPPADRVPALCRRLLELNARGLVNAAFGLLGDRVVVVSERPTAGLDAREAEQIVRHLSAVADTYDDRLVKEFGGQRASEPLS